MHRCYLITFPPFYSFSQWPAYKQQFTSMLLPMFKVLSVHFYEKSKPPVGLYEGTGRERHSPSPLLPHLAPKVGLGKLALFLISSQKNKFSQGCLNPSSLEKISLNLEHNLGEGAGAEGVRTNTGYSYCHSAKPFQVVDSSG